MPSRSDKRILMIVALVFGVLGAAAGGRWLNGGSIVIRQGEERVGGGGGDALPVPQDDAPVAGTIGPGHLLYYPLCVTWVGLGASMAGLAALSFFTGRDLFLRLTAYSCLAFFLLGFGTVAAALLAGT